MKRISKRLTVSCGIVPVKFKDNKPLFLMLRSYDYWDFPKGKMESNESFIETATREMKEETNIELSDLDFKWGYVSKDTELYKKGTKYAKYFVAESKTYDVDLPISPELGVPEHNEFRWVSYDAGMNLSKKRVGEILKWANGVVSGG